MHVQAAAFTGVRVVPPGRLHGRLEPGDLVTFEGRHLGWRMRLTARVVEMVRPGRFVDESVAGPFRTFRHTHEFREAEGATVMTDTLEWISPLGFVGRLVDRLLLRRHLTWFIEQKQRALKSMAEQGDASTPGHRAEDGVAPDATRLRA